MDGVYAVTLNRDDASGFPLDTLTTCKQHATPVVRGQETWTTRTDFVNKHPSVIQITSYNFTGTGTTPERCVGVVKAVPLHHKNPAQQAADLAMIQAKNYHQCFFIIRILSQSSVSELMVQRMRVHRMKKFNSGGQ